MTWGDTRGMGVETGMMPSKLDYKDRRLLLVSQLPFENEVQH